LLCKDARRTEECRVYIFENDSNSSSPSISEEHSSICDDIVVKSVQRRDHIGDLAEIFANLRAANLKLSLGIHKGKVLGCLVSTKGLEANPDKIKALIDMQDPISVKDVQKLREELLLSIGSSLGMQKEACLFSKFSEVPRTFSGPKLRNKLFKNTKTICRI
jgi:hypothetical protein